VVRQLAKESPAVVIAKEDLRAAVARARHAIEGIGKVDAWRARHALRILSLLTACKRDSVKARTTLPRLALRLPRVGLRSATDPTHEFLHFSILPL